MFTRMQSAMPTQPSIQTIAVTSVPLPRHRVQIYSRNPVEQPAVVTHQIFIIEDHPAIREIYVQLIQREPDLAVWGQAATATQALEAVTDMVPDLVLLDMALPEMNGLEVLRRLLADHPNLAVLVISGEAADIYAREALLSGAKGYLDKAGLASVLITAIRTILQGKIYVSAAVRKKLGDLDDTSLQNLIVSQ